MSDLDARRAEPQKPPDRQLTVREAAGKQKQEEEKKNRGGTVRRERCGRKWRGRRGGGEASVCNP